jgi:hypothetical protein
MNDTSREAGAVNPLVVSNAILAILAIALGSVMVWALINYNDQKTNVDSKIETAVTEAKKVQTAADEKDFLEREKSPYDRYVGPDDLGRVSFNYPKTWSGHVNRDPAQGELEAYFHPGVVPFVITGQQFALEIKVQRRGYESFLKSFESNVKRGDLKSTPVVINGFNGIRLDGKFSQQIEGSMVVFKLRDKTLTVATDAATFRGDFDNIILKSLDFNP